jgi:hypothetical protein
MEVLRIRARVVGKNMHILHVSYSCFGYIELSARLILIKKQDKDT